MIYFDQMSQCMKNNAVMAHINYISGIRNKIKVGDSLLSSQGNIQLYTYLKSAFFQRFVTSNLWAISNHAGLKPTSCLPLRGLQDI